MIAFSVGLSVLTGVCVVDSDLPALSHNAFALSYSQSAFAMPTREKTEQEQRPLLKIEDNFKKIIITKDSPTIWYTEEGILVMSIYDFMLNENSLDE